MASPLTLNRLWERSLFYLERYAASEQGVRRVLQRGLKRDAMRGVEIPSDVSEWINTVVTRLRDAGYLNDQSFAAMKTRSLRLRGASTQKIKQKLLMQGVDGGVIDEALQGEEGGTDQVAAIAFARKRRLGVFAPPETRESLREKHLGSFARAGFSRAVALVILNAENAEDLREEEP